MHSARNARATNTRRQNLRIQSYSVQHLHPTPTRLPYRARQYNEVTRYRQAGTYKIATPTATKPVALCTVHQ